MPWNGPLILPWEQGGNPQPGGAQPGLTYDPNHVQEAKAIMAQQYRERTTPPQVISALLGEVQALEDAIWGVYIGRNILSAVGAQLDVFGKIVGQPRNGFSDADYLPQLLARVAVNRSSGTPEELYAIFKLVMFAGGTMRIQNFYPAAFEFFIGAAPMPVNWASIFLGFLQSARAAGVGGVLRYSLLTPAATLSFAASGGGAGPGLGFNQGGFSSAYR